MQAKRSLLCRYLDISGDLVLIGQGFTENTTEYNPDSDDIQYINEDTKRTELKTYAPTTSLEGVVEMTGSGYPKTLDPIFAYLNDLRRNRTIGAEGYIVEVELYTCTEYDSTNNVFKNCKSTKNKVNFQFDEFGGEAGNSISFKATINYVGEPMETDKLYDVTNNSNRTATPSNKTYKYVTYSTSHVTKKIGDLSVLSNGDLSAMFKADTGYTLPSTVTVEVGETPKTVSTHYTWDSTTGILYIKPEVITDNVTITVTGTT